MNTSVINTLGVEATTVEQTLKTSNLDWEPLSDAVAGADTGIIMPRFKLLYRSDTREALGVVGKDYAPSQPRAFVESQFEFAEFIGGKVARVGFIEDRARAFAFVKMDKQIDIPKKDRKVGDPMSVYIYSSDGWDGGTPRRSRLYIERLRCLNGMTSKEIKADLWVSHTANMEEAYNTRWKVFMNEVRKSVDAVQAQFERLAATRMTEQEAKLFVAQLIPGEGTRADNTRTSLLDLFAHGTGNDGTTRWDAYNAVTEYVTHQRTYKDTDRSAPETNRFLGVLEKNKLAPAALSLLLN